MLTTPRAQVIEKMITSEEGIVFKAVFLVYEEAGKMKARLVRVTPVAKKAQEIIFALTGDIQTSPAIEIVSEIAEKHIVSPYSSVLYFTGSKPRAPTLFA